MTLPLSLSLLYLYCNSLPICCIMLPIALRLLIAALQLLALSASATEMDSQSSPSSPWTKQTLFFLEPWWECLPLVLLSECTVSYCPHWTQSLIKWHLMSMCFDRSWKNGFSESSMQLWLSHKIFVASIFLLSRFTSNFLSHLASRDAMLTAIYSTSAELKATNFCFLLH